jgi:hypothetical protein
LETVSVRTDYCPGDSRRNVATTAGTYLGILKRVRRAGELKSWLRRQFLAIDSRTPHATEKHPRVGRSQRMQRGQARCSGACSDLVRCPKCGTEFKPTRVKGPNRRSPGRIARPKREATIATARAPYSPTMTTADREVPKQCWICHKALSSAKDSTRQDEFGFVVHQACFSDLTKRKNKPFDPETPPKASE